MSSVNSIVPTSAIVFLHFWLSSDAVLSPGTSVFGHLVSSAPTVVLVIGEVMRRGLSVGPRQGRRTVSPIFCAPKDNGPGKKLAPAVPREHFVLDIGRFACSKHFNEEDPVRFWQSGSIQVRRVSNNYYKNTLVKYTLVRRVGLTNDIHVRRVHHVV